MVLPKLFETDGAANFTTNVVDIKGALKPIRLDLIRFEFRKNENR